MVSRRSLKKYKLGKKSKIHKSNFQIGGDERWTQFLRGFMGEYRFEQFKYDYKDKRNTYIQDKNKKKKIGDDPHIHVFDDQSGAGIHHIRGSDFRLQRLDSVNLVTNIAKIASALVEYWPKYPNFLKKVPQNIDDLPIPPIDTLWSPFLIRIIKELLLTEGEMFNPDKIELINEDTIKYLNTVLNCQLILHLHSIGIDRDILRIIINNLDLLTFDDMCKKIVYVNNCFKSLSKFKLDTNVGMRRIEDGKEPFTYTKLIELLFLTKTSLQRSFWNDEIHTFKRKLIDKIKRDYNYISFDTKTPDWKNIDDFFSCLSYECRNPGIRSNYPLKYTDFDPTKNINSEIISQLNSICETQSAEHPSICPKFSDKLSKPPELYLRNSEGSNYLCRKFLKRQNNYTAMYLLYTFINNKLNDEFIKLKHDRASKIQQINQEQILHIFYVLICNQSGISDASNIILEMNDFEYIDKLEKLYSLSTQIHAQITY